MLLLAFDTATPAVTVALHDGTQVLAEVTTVGARRHGELLAASIDAVLTGAGASRRDITAVATGTGPGPYAGLRTGLVTARVLGSALGVPVHGICTLDIIASDAVAQAEGQPFVVATDARRSELYWAQYSSSGTRLAGPSVGPPTDIQADLPVAGQGGLLYPSLPGRPIAPQYPAAGTLALLAAAWLSAGRPALPVEPVHLRSPGTRVPGSAKRVSLA